MMKLQLKKFGDKKNSVTIHMNNNNPSSISVFVRYSQITHTSLLVYI